MNTTNTQKGFVVPLIIAIVVILIGGVVYFANKNKTAPSNVEAVVTTTPEKIAGNLQKIGDFKGYYAQFGDNNASGTLIICDDLVIVSGDKEMMKRYEDMMMKYYEDKTDSYQAFNHRDEENRIAINLDMKALTVTQREMIKNSKSNEQITLTVKEKDLEPSAVAACRSYFDVLSIKK